MGAVVNEVGPSSQTTSSLMAETDRYSRAMPQKRGNRAGFSEEVLSGLVLKSPQLTLLSGQMPSCCLSICLLGSVCSKKLVLPPDLP